jgi:hypothetical protein
MQPKPWPSVPLNYAQFQEPPGEYGILPFWFLNGELDPDEMRYQLRQFSQKGMPGVILHGRYGLETPYIGSTYLERIRFAVDEAVKLGLQTWVYDEMNWPSGTADKRVLLARPDLAQRYIECINFTIRGPWFTYLTGADSRYLDFERSTPVAAFAVRLDGEHAGQVLDLTPNLSFTNVIPWEAPAGNWRLIYIVEKQADYYIDAINPESTREYLRLGYEPYARALGKRLSSEMLGFYTDEPAMHYFLSSADNAVVPWTKDMFRRFQERNGYNLRPRLPDLFFNLSPESARVRYDFYNSLTDFYSQAYYQQIHEWCQAHDVLFTGHLLYEEGVRGMIRVEGNLYKHYQHMDVIGVDHLYPIIGTRDRPVEHVAMKVASSAAHQLGSPRLLCESFGGIFMDATMQRMKWIADWEYVLGVNLLNPHGFHYTLEGPRKRDWPPSQFYQYPWWQYYAHFSDYMKRLSHLLSGGRHVAKAAVLWPINAMFALYTPQQRTVLGERLENDFNTLTDLLLRLHFDYDYLDEDLLASAELQDNTIRIGDETYELIILPPLAHLKLSTVERLEQFIANGGKILGMIFLPDQAFGPHGLVDVSARVQALFNVDPVESQLNHHRLRGIEFVEHKHPSGGQAGFLRSYALARQLPLRLQQELRTPGKPESPLFSVETGSAEVSRYYFTPPEGQRQDITAEVLAERQAVSQALEQALGRLVTPDVTIDNPEIFYLHRVKDDQHIYFFTNPTFFPQAAEVGLAGEYQPILWDPSTGAEQPLAPWQVTHGWTRFQIQLPPTGSAFVLVNQPSHLRIVDANLKVDAFLDKQIKGYGTVTQGRLVIERNGQQLLLAADAGSTSQPLVFSGDWEFSTETPNALVIGQWLTAAETPGKDWSAYAAPESVDNKWLPMVPGAWSYQLPIEPTAPYPIPVWYRIPFEAAYLPPKLDLIVDGFAGQEWKLFVNGQPVTAQPQRSTFDSQMQSVNITPHTRLGKNLIALRLVLTNATDGLLDLLKIMGDFSLESSQAGYCLAAPRPTIHPAPWTDQGYPHFSGQAVYRQRFSFPAGFAGKRVFLEPPMGDDVLEVLVNGRSAGVRLWAPYSVEVTDFLTPGENTLELRVSNTLVNLLEAVERPSGLGGAPQLTPYHSFSFDIPD